MGWGKPFSSNGWVTNIVRAAAPIAGFAVGGPIGAAIGGGLGGAIGGGGISGITKGAALGGLTGWGANALGLGGSIGGLFGGGAGSAAGSSGGGLLSSLGGLFGGGAGAGASGIVDLGTAMPWKNAGSATSLFGGGGGGLFGSGRGALTSLVNPASSLFGGFMTSNAQKDAEKQLLAQQERARAALAPYQQSGLAANQALASKLASGELGGTFTPGDLTKTPGYQFDLSQGEQALARRQAASGNYFSGQALKEAQDYGIGLAEKTYGDAYNRWLQGQENTYRQFAGQSAAGQNAAAGLGGIYQGMGETQAGGTLGQSDTINKTIAALLSGSGALGRTPTLIGGQVVYV